jgi:predicted transcriptional regulator
MEDVLHMKKPLLDVIFASDKRKHTLLLLKDGSQEMEYLLKSLSTNRQALLPQIRVLEEHYLVNHYEDTYELTTIGKLIVDEMTPMLNTVEVLDVDIDYWGNRNLDFIPSYLLKRIDELDKCKIITPPIMKMYDINEEFFEQCKSSKSVTKITTFLYPNFVEIYGAWVKMGVQVTIVVNKELFQRIKLNYAEQFRELLTSGKFSLFMCSQKMDFISFGYNDYCTFFRLLLKTNEYDNKQLMCCKLSSIKWSIELCEYYLKDSTPIMEL